MIKETHIKMNIKLDNPLILVRAVEIVSELVTEVKIRITPEGLQITAMDPANVSMVNFKINKSAFSEFESGNDVLGINLESLKQILRRCGSNSSLILEREENMLKIAIQDKIQRRFTLNLINIDSEDIDFEEKVKNMEFTSRVEMNSQDLIASVEDCAVVADACSFIIENEKFIIEAKSMNSARSEFTPENVKIQAEDCRSKFSIEYLQKFMKGAKLSDKVLLRFSEDHPLRIDFSNPSVELGFVLAPRIETED